LNEYKLSASRTAASKLFHTTGPATEKALSPNFVLVRVKRDIMVIIGLNLRNVIVGLFLLFCRLDTVMVILKVVCLFSAGVLPRSGLSMPLSTDHAPWDSRLSH